MRKIIHVDMDAFYASIEQRDDPALRGLPVAVGGSSRRGVVMTASYEARQFGVRSAMPTYQAQRLCPELVIVRPHFDQYKAASQVFRDILRSFSETIEPLSLDEAFIDVTELSDATTPATHIAQAIRARIAKELALTASAGVSYNKFLAKLASGLNKPDGIFVIRPERAKALLAELPIERFHGVGPATASRLKSAGIHTGRDLQALCDTQADKLPGHSGRWFWQLAHGIDERPVSADGVRKSVSVETTFTDNVSAPDRLAEILSGLAEQLATRCRRADFWGRTLTLKLKYHDFQIRTRSRSFDRLEPNAMNLAKMARLMLDSQPLEKPVRLIGLGMSRPVADVPDTDQLALPLTDSRSA